MWFAKWLRRKNTGTPGTVLNGVSEVLKHMQAQPSETLSLSQYLAELADVPLPTQQQREDFVEHVFHAHSWYKHLPMYLPGVPFYFFIDKHAGWARRARKVDSAFVDCVEVQTGFLPTEEYRNRFGHLAYSHQTPATVLAISQGDAVAPKDKNDIVAGQMRGLPGKILQAGVAHLTGVIHVRAYFQDFWGDLEADVSWPEALGGRATLEMIFERVRKCRNGTLNPENAVEQGRTVDAVWRDDMLRRYLEQVDPVLYELIEPERLRQRSDALKAIDNVCRIIETARQGAT